MSETYPEATNFQYIDREDRTVVKKIFMNDVNSFHGTAIVQKILSRSLNSKSFVKPGDLTDEETDYEVYGTLNDDDRATEPAVKLLNVNSESFFESVLECDIIILDISQSLAQLTLARNFLKYFESALENSKVDEKKHLILVSTIMTWAQTPQKEDEILTDSDYRRRRPHPCFVNHMLLERDVINLPKKYKELVSSVVVCPGIIYGDRQDIFHFLYKKCYFNNLQVDIFAPATNYLPLIYIDDFAKIIMLILLKSPDSNPYILAVQPETLHAKNIIANFAESAGGPETRIRICTPDEIFLMKEELMTVRTLSSNIARNKVFFSSNESSTI